MIYARIQNGTVAELFTPPPGFTLAECFHANIAAQFVLISGNQNPVPGWTYNGTNFAPPPAPPAPVAMVPETVSNFQARAVLMGMPGSTAGTTLLDDVNAWVTAQGGLAYQAWEYGVEVRRDSALIAAAGTHFGLSSTQLDQMFITAATILA